MNAPEWDFGVIAEGEPDYGVVESMWVDREFLPGEAGYYAGRGMPSAHEVYLTTDPVAGAIPAGEYQSQVEAAGEEAKAEAAYAAYIETLEADAAEPEAGS